MKHIDLFFGAGQSNAVGMGDSSQSPIPDVNHAFYFNGSGNIVSVTDPVTGPEPAFTGSLWPQFAKDYFRLTGRDVGVVSYSIGGSAQCAAAQSDPVSGHWDVSGGHYPAAKSHFDAAISAFQAAGWEVRVRGLIWCQGETDALKIATSVITPAQYATGLASMLARFRADYGPEFPIFCIRTGTNYGSGDGGFAEIRSEQELRAFADPNFFIATRDTVDFGPKGWMNGLHYNQAGLNHVGAAVASYISYGGLGECIKVVRPESWQITLPINGGAPLSVTGIEVTRGRWLVSGRIHFRPEPGTLVSLLSAGISNISGVLPSVDNEMTSHLSAPFSSNGGIVTVPIGVSQISLTSPIVLHLIAQANFCDGGCAVFGSMQFTRISRCP